MKSWRKVLETKMAELLTKDGVSQKDARQHAKECLEPRHLDTALRSLNAN